MPPKRKTPPDVIEEGIPKRSTYSRNRIRVETQAPAITTTSPQSTTKSVSIIRTYGKTQRKGLTTHKSIENIGSQDSRHDGLPGVGDESSEDELNLTRSSESSQRGVEMCMTSNDTEISVSKYGATRVKLDTKTPTPKSMNETDLRPVKTIEQLHHITSEPESPGLTTRRRSKKTEKSTLHQADELSPSRPRKTPNKSLPQNVNPKSPLVSAPNPRRSTRTSLLKISNDISMTHKLAREQDITSENTTPTKQTKRLLKWELEQGRDSPSSRPLPKKRKVTVDADLLLSSPAVAPDPAPHTLSRALTHGNPTFITKFISPSIDTPPQKSSKQLTSKLVLHTRIPETLPSHLHSCLQAQKRALLRTLQKSFDLRSGHKKDANDADFEPGANEVARQQLHDLLSGTVDRGEGNSCLILGPRGSGKSRLVENCLLNISARPIVLRLSGWTQSSDRLAMREIAYQLNHQTGTNLPVHSDDTPEDKVSDHANESNPFLDKPASLPSSSHLHALISMLPTLSRPTIVILDGFDLFSLHPRQSLLYCLLDTAQSCRAGINTKGLAIIGITTRIDTINLLEKRVKSRFSGRILRTAPLQKVDDWVNVARSILTSNVTFKIREQIYSEEWKVLWNTAVEEFLGNKAAMNTLNETFSITRDIRMLSKIMVSLILHLTPNSPFPSATGIISTVVSQRTRPRMHFLHTLSYPALCLLIAGAHVDTAGHQAFTFEMLHECFHDQLRASTSAPVQVNGTSIGMVRCSREVLLSAFEHLVSVKIFMPITLSTNAKEFVRYRCAVEREDIKKTVDKTGQINLRKWFMKAS